MIAVIRFIITQYNVIPRTGFSKNSELSAKRTPFNNHNNHLLSKFQFGFRKNHSTQFSVTYFMDNVLKAMDKGNLTGALFIGVRKAFDTLPHISLLQKLERYGIMDTPLA